MESSRQKKCPFCFSEDVIDTGNRTKSESKMSFGDVFNVPSFPIYKCYKCYRPFIYQNQSEERDNFRSDDLGGGMPF